MGCFISCFRDGDDEDDDRRRHRPSLHHNVIVLQNCNVEENPDSGSPEINELSEEESSDEAVTPKDQCRNKSVRFECDSSSSDSKNSPFPTPLKLSDEMQTPGTAFVTNIEDVANGKKTRIRAQYVCPVLNPVEVVVSSNSNQPSRETWDAYVKKLILFDEIEEACTALSQARSSVHGGESVVLV